MKIIKLEASGLEVKRWQAFLKQQNLFTGDITGQFDTATKMATVAYQSNKNLGADGVVGNMTVSAAAEDGFVDVFKPDFPNRPSFKPLASNEAKAVRFGRFEYEAAPKPDNKESIEILGDWENENIVSIDIPQLIRIKGNAKARFHKLVAPKVKKLFSDWEEAGLIDNIISWEGGFVPRFIRGSTTVLSNHSFGSAFDINAGWNGLNAVSAPIGAKGCVKELVAIAHKNGFFWGGHFSREDGMHFELAVIEDGINTRGGFDLDFDFETAVYDVEGQG